MEEKIRTYIIRNVQTELNRMYCKYDIVFHIDGRNCKTVEQVFTEFKRVLKFPEYFGGNWDSFDEVFNDAEWVYDSGKSFVIFITDADKILQGDEENFKRFMRILTSAPKEWELINKKRGKIIFHTTHRECEGFKRRMDF